MTEVTRQGSRRWTPRQGRGVRRAWARQEAGRVPFCPRPSSFFTPRAVLGAFHVWKKKMKSHIFHAQFYYVTIVAEVLLQISTDVKNSEVKKTEPVRQWSWKALG